MRVTILAGLIRIKFIIENLDRVDVKGDRNAVLPENDGAGFLSAVADAELIEHIGIKAADVGERNPAVHDVLEHILADRA